MRLEDLGLCQALLAFLHIRLNSDALQCFDSTEAVQGHHHPHAVPAARQEEPFWSKATCSYT